jgi:WD40 repeat protein
MPDFQEPPRDEQGTGWEAVDRVVKAFEDAWGTGTPPSIEDFLRGDGTRGDELLWELVHVDLERRCKTGRAIALEEYLRRFPRLREDAARELELIVTDFRLRRRAGAACDPSDYLRRFPEHQGELAARLAAEDKVIPGDAATPTAAGYPLEDFPTTPELDAPPVESPDTAGESENTSGLPAVPGYVMLRKLGGGGMGVVYQACQLQPKRDVAIKMIRNAEFADPETIQRFLAEAGALARLQNPHIVQVFTVGEANGLPYISLEYCPGGSLDKKLGGTPQPPRDAADLVRTLAGAVDAAHRAKVVHRDLKPANVLIDAAETPKITDFGLAKTLDDKGPTISGAVLGTPSYMAPEQALGKGREVGPLADVYALGAILYECLTGRPPFKAATALETLEQVAVNDPVPPRRLIPGIPTDLQTISLKCLSKLPSKRYRSAKALADDLQRYLDRRPIRAVPPNLFEITAKWVGRRPAVAALTLMVATLAAFALGAVLWFNSELVDQRNRADERASAATTAEKKAVANAEAERLARERADQGLYYALIGQAARQIEANDWAGARIALDRIDKSRRHWEYFYLHRQVEGTPLAILGLKESFPKLRYSPDGSRLATVGGNTVRIWDPRTGKECISLHGHARAIEDLSWSPDGSRLATLETGGTVRVLDSLTGKQTLALEGGGWSSVTWSPSGAQLAVAGTNGVAELRDAHSGERIRSVSWSDGKRSSARWSPNCSLLIIQTANRSFRIRNVHTGQEQILSNDSMSGMQYPTWSPDGSRFATHSNGSIEIWDAWSGKLLVTLRAKRNSVFNVTWSPDGSRLAAASSGGLNHVWDTRSGREVLSFGAESFNSMTSIYWSPDGALLATSTQGGPIRIWSAYSGNELLTLPAAPGAIASTAWSPGCFRLATASLDGTVRIWDVRPARQPAGSDGQAFSVDVRGRCACMNRIAWSPDGSKLVTALADSTTILDVRTGRVDVPRSIAATKPTAVAWSPDGLRLVTAGRDNLVRVWDARLETEQFTFRGHSIYVDAVCWSPDGTRIATAGRDSTVRVWDARKGVELTVIPFPKDQGGGGGATCLVAFSPDGGRLLTAIRDGPLQIWDGRTGREILGFPWQSVALTSANWSPDGTRIATSAEDGTAKVWDSRSGVEQIDINGHTRSVNGIAWSPDGDRLCTASGDGALRLWDSSNGQEVVSLRTDEKVAGAALWSPDGRQMAVLLQSGRVKLLDARLARETVSIRGHTGKVYALAFLPNDNRLLTLDSFQQKRLWEVPTGRVVQATLPPPTPRPNSTIPPSTARQPQRGSQELPELPQNSTRWATSADGAWLAHAVDEVIYLQSLRSPPAPWGYDAWEEESDRNAMAPLWHAEDAAAAEANDDAFATAFHLGWLITYRPFDQSLWERRATVLERMGRGEESSAHRWTAAALRAFRQWGWLSRPDTAGVLVGTPSTREGVAPILDGLRTGNLSTRPQPIDGQDARSNALSANSVSPVDPDRAAAEWVLSLGGVVRLAPRSQDLSQTVELGGPRQGSLPKEPFRVVGIDLWGNPSVTDGGLQKLKSLQSLRTIGINNASISDVGLAYLGDVRSLRSLDLARTAITDEGLSHLEPLPLEQLFLGHCRIGKKGLQSVARLKRLTCLDLNHTPVTDEDLQLLAELANLQMLNLEYTRVTDVGLDAVSLLRGLKTLELGQSRVTEGGVDGYRTRHPGCTVNYKGRNAAIR